MGFKSTKVVGHRINDANSKVSKVVNERDQKAKKSYGRETGGIFVKRPKPNKERKLQPQTIIEWDDVNGRPIFKNPPKANKTTRGEIVRGENILLDDDENRKEKFIGRKKSKSYKMQKKEFYFPSTPKLIKMKQPYKPVKKQDMKATANSFSFSSPAPNVRVCHQLSSKKKRKHGRRKVSRNLNNLVFDKRKQEIDKIYPNDPFEFVEEKKVVNLKQPNSNTTDLAAAKAFFDNLDATESLEMISVHHKTAPAPSKCGRSMRRINVNDPELQQEYHAYTAASHQSGVEPLPLIEFARNRSNIFRPNELFDGFLDV